MIKLRQAIVVEGRYDKNALCQLVDAPVIETHGFGVMKDRRLLGFLRQVAAARGLIILTDSDGAGFVNDLTGRCGVSLLGKRVLVIGAGGAARGVLAAICSQGCARITVSNRTIGAAIALADEMGVHYAAFTDLTTGYDIVINATSAGLSNASPAVPGTIFKDCEIACDLFYAKTSTPFMRFASESGCRRVEDGLGMLIEQAAESFHIWLGARPDTKPVYAALRG